ncbi:ciliary microtubule inner protein 1 isoform X1 [Pseudophryne corroboree]|uniref:ciliary microtubule inner protein 1 isoform X1 n=1 Tax=Pseudophryne corroboree TaxID=495146 RepID=UPI00308120EB
MAAPQHSPQLGKEINFVAQDMIWKSHIKSEMETARSWPNNWGFLTTSHNELVENKTEENKVQLKVPEHLQVRPVTPVETYIKVGPSPAIPQTTQGLIGWRSTIAELQLEHYGRSKYLKGDFCKSMNWPAEGLS